MHHDDIGVDRRYIFPFFLGFDFSDVEVKENVRNTLMVFKDKDFLFFYFYGIRYKKVYK